MYHKWRSYDAWFLRYKAQQSFLSFWAIFCPFNPPNKPEIEILKKWKKHLEISSFYTSVPKIIIICYTVPEIWCVTDVIIIFSFWAIFCPFTPTPPLTVRKIKLLKKWKKLPEISSFYKCVPKTMITWYTVPEIWCATEGRTDEWIERRKKWHIGGCST